MKPKGHLGFTCTGAVLAFPKVHQHCCRRSNTKMHTDAERIHLHLSLTLNGKTTIAEGGRDRCPSGNQSCLPVPGSPELSPPTPHLTEGP